MKIKLPFKFSCVTNSVLSSISDANLGITVFNKYSVALTTAVLCFTWSLEPKKLNASLLSPSSFTYCLINSGLNNLYKWLPLIDAIGLVGGKSLALSTH